MNKNPFVLPGLGQSGPMSQNPILASMEMMRQAWEGLAATGGMDAGAMERMMSVEDMDKRISDLRAVENWLRMNLSMLSSTIQGLEVQRATVATLKSFAETGMASMSQAAAKAAPPSSAAPASGKEPPRESADSGSRPASDAQAAAGSPLEQALGMTPGASTDGASAQADIVGAAASAAQGWWNLLQNQFQTLAAATAASAENAAAGTPPPSGSGKAAGTAAKAAAKRASKAPAKTASRSTAAKTSTKPAARKTAR